MTRFECTECGQLIRMPPQGRSTVSMECPGCGETTAWRRAFDGEGVSF